MYFNQSGRHTPDDGKQRTDDRQGSTGAAQRWRLHIYRSALVRLRLECTAGTPPVRAAWQAAREMDDRYTLDTRHCALLVRALIAAALDA